MRTTIGRSSPLWLALVVAVATAGCLEDTPTTVVVNPDVKPLFSISDGAHDGTGGFYFLPPMTANPWYTGTFDTELSPVVEICETVACGAPLHAIFSMTEGTGSELVRLVEEDEHYIVNWHTNATGAVVDQTYRVRVVVGDVVLGHADVIVVSTAREAVSLRSDGSIALVAGQTLPIKVRIETGIAGAIAVSPGEATIYVGETQQFAATVYDLHGEVLPGATVSWSSSVDAVATVDPDGLATGEAEGDATISAMLGTLAGTAALTVQLPDAGPPPGRDIVVFNDVNHFDNVAMANPNNVRMVQNLVDYTAPGPRSDATTVWFDCGRNSKYTLACSNFTAMVSTIQGSGLTVQNIPSSSGSLTGIPAQVKVIVLWLPTVHYETAEINALKQFAEEGGRIIFVGEWDGFYGATGLAVQNQLLLNLGAVLRNTGGRVDCGGHHTLPATSLRPHQVTEGLTEVVMGCASTIEPGPDDYPLIYDSTNTLLIAGVARIDTTPIAALQGVGTMMLMTVSDESLNPDSPTGH